MTLRRGGGVRLLPSALPVLHEAANIGARASHLALYRVPVDEQRATRCQPRGFPGNPISTESVLAKSSRGWRRTGAAVTACTPVTLCDRRAARPPSPNSASPRCSSRWQRMTAFRRSTRAHGRQEQGYGCSTALSTARRAEASSRSGTSFAPSIQAASRRSCTAASASVSAGLFSTSCWSSAISSSSSSIR